MPYLLFVILLVIAGVVAAAGDRMGHRAARAKIRFGKLRPRTVSTMIAVTSGLLITIVTYAALFFTWSDFRDALLKYDQTKHKLSQANEELSGFNARLDQAHAQLSQSEGDLSKTHSELVDRTADLGRVQQQMEQVDQVLAAKEREVKRLGGDVEAKRQEVNTLDSNLQALRQGMREMKESKETGNIVLPMGYILAYQQVPPNQAGDVAGLMPDALAQARANLPKGLELDSQSNEAAVAFARSYPYPDASVDGLIVVSCASNVFEGDEVQLAFDAVLLTPLVKPTERVLEVVIGPDQAQVKWFGRQLDPIPVPAQFDRDSLVEFFVALEDIVQEQARAMGFLPDLATRAVPSPVESLANESVANELIARPRPVEIVFMSKSSFNALDGLTGMNIFIPPADTTAGATP